MSRTAGENDAKEGPLPSMDLESMFDPPSPQAVHARSDRRGRAATCQRRFDRFHLVSGPILIPVFVAVAVVLFTAHDSLGAWVWVLLAVQWALQTLLALSRLRKRRRIDQRS